jgi:hypothetical protein
MLIYWPLEDDRGWTVHGQYQEDFEMMEKFDFLLGTWKMEYRIPESEFSPAMTGSGSGTFRRALDDKYVYFNYSASFSRGDRAEAHGVFAWDDKSKIHRYWWFENSGNFDAATCRFLKDGLLFMNWHGSLMSQTFAKTGPDSLVLRMRHPDSGGKQKTVMEVAFIRSRER